MRPFDIHPDRKPDRGLLELFAHHSQAKSMYHNYRQTILGTLRPDWYATVAYSFGKRQAQFPDLDSEIAIRRVLTKKLARIIVIAAEDLHMPESMELELSQWNTLAVYGQFIGEAADLQGQDLVQIEPVLERLKNPLTDMTLLQKVGRWLVEAADLPELHELIHFSEP